jgi:hypothetical protein
VTDPSRKQLQRRLGGIAGHVPAEWPVNFAGIRIRTSTEHKLAAMRVIEKKCLETGRTDFEFWQAHYSHGTRQISLAPLRLLKITPAGGQ